MNAETYDKELENSSIVKELENSENKGGNTNYYTLPRPSKELIKDLIDVYIEHLQQPICLEAFINELYKLFPNTLNDLIEYKDMKPWQHEMFKSLYAMNERASRSTDGSSSIERELNKQRYYLSRGRTIHLKHPNNI